MLFVALPRRLVWRAGALDLRQPQRDVSAWAELSLQPAWVEFFRSSRRLSKPVGGKGGLVDEDLWRAMVLWLLPERTDVRGGPPRVSNRAALAGILFVLRHGLRWRDLPQELGYGSGVTCWRRLHQWQALGVWSACIARC